MTTLKNKGLFTAYVFVVMWYIFFSGSIILRPFSGFAWFGLALLGFLFDTKPRGKACTSSKQIKNYFTLSGIFFLSCLYSMELTSSVRYFLVTVMFFIIAYIITNDAEKIRITMKVSFGFCVVLGVITFIQMFLPELYIRMFLPFLPYPEEVIGFMKAGSMTGFTNQTGSNAFFLVLGFAMSVFLIEKNKFWKYLLVIAFFIALLATSRRGPVVIAIALFVVFGFKGGIKGWVERACVMIVAFFLLSFLGEFIPYISNVTDKFAHLAEGGDILNGRGNVYEILLRGIDERPFFGHGINTLATYMDSTQGELIVSHNAYLQYAFEIGVVGCMFLFVVLLYPVKVLLSEANREGEDSVNINKIKLCLFVQTFLLVWGLIESAFYDQYRLFLMMVFQMAALVLIDDEKSARGDKCQEQIKR